VGKESEAYNLFFYAINAEQTREKYVVRMNKDLEIIGCDHEKNYPHVEKTLNNPFPIGTLHVHLDLPP
jgi:hypothetical protein